MFVPRVDKKVPRDDKDKYIARAIEMFREELWRSEMKPVEFHGHFSEKELAATSDFKKTPEKEHTPADETVAVIGGKAKLANDISVSEEKKLSHNKKRKSTMLSPQHISSVKKKSKKEKNKNNNMKNEMEEETKIEKVSCSTMFDLIDCFVNEKMFSFGLQLSNMERLINLHMNKKDNKDVPVNVAVDSDSKSHL